MGGRKNEPYGWALIGGFVDVGESAEQAAMREVKVGQVGPRITHSLQEETGLSIDNLQQIRLFSAPDRDPRRHTASMLFAADLVDLEELRAGDDVVEVLIQPLTQLGEVVFAFEDHKRMIEHYLLWKKRDKV